MDLCLILSRYVLPDITKVIFTVPFYYNAVQDDPKSTTTLFLSEYRFLPPDFWQGNPLFLQNRFPHFLPLLQVTVSLCNSDLKTMNKQKSEKPQTSASQWKTNLLLSPSSINKHPCLTHCPTVHTNLLSHYREHKLGKGEQERWRVGSIFRGL